MKELIKDFMFTCWLLICVLGPLFIGVIPVIPAIIFNSPNCMWLMLVSAPMGIAVSMQTWDPDFIIRNKHKKRNK